jgi:hypothetical protein
MRRGLPILSRMKSGPATIALVVGASLASVGGLAACGSDGDGKRLPRATAAEMRSTLDRVERDVGADDCESASTQTRALVDRAGGLPDSIDADLRTALVDGADRLQVLVTQRCSTSSTGATGPTNTGTGAETGPTGPAGGQEKQKGPGNGKSKGPKKPKGPKHEQPGTTDENQSGSTGGNGLDNQDSGGAAP